MYVVATNAKSTRAVILSKMTAKVQAVLPEALALNQLMHVDRRGFDVFDISVSRLQPQTTAAKAAFKNQIAKNVTARTVYRFLSDDNSNEKDAYHIEIKK